MLRRWAKWFNLKRALGLGVVTVSAAALRVPGSELAATTNAQIARAQPCGEG